VTRYGTQDSNANLAVEMFRDIVKRNRSTAETVWVAIAQLLITCEVFEGGRWRQLYGAPVLMERNNYGTGARGDNKCLREARSVGAYIAAALGVDTTNVCDSLGLYFKNPAVHHLQPNNLRGHAFRSVVAEALDMFGDRTLDLYEEQSPHEWFPGFQFQGRSSAARIDILAVRQKKPVAIISTRWTYRHDRVDLIDEAREYLPAARRMNSNCDFFGVTAEFGIARLKKVLAVTEPAQPKSAPIRRLVHLNAHLPGALIGRDRDIADLWSLSDLIADSFSWQ
jgi:hypothetical protein